MPKLSPTEIYQLAIQAGFSQTDAVKATAIALAESGGQTDVVNSIGATGLWQIYDGVYPSQQRIAQLSDPLTNARIAFSKFMGTQNSMNGGWCQWAAYDETSPLGNPCPGAAQRNNTWRNFLGMSTAAATGVDISQGSSNLVVPTDGGFNPSPGGVFGGSVGTINVGGTGGGDGGPAQRLLQLGSFLGQPVGFAVGAAWSAFFILGAVALIGLGVYVIFHKQIDAAAGGVVKAAAVAA